MNQAEGVEALFRKYASFVAAMVRRIGGVREHEVDDVVQDVFVVAHQRGGYVHGPARPHTWLCEIAIRVLANRRRAWVARRSIADEETVARAVSSEPTPFDVMVRAEAMVSVQRALDTLDLEHRAVFVLFELAGESCEEIAAALRISLGTVHSRLHAARIKFKKAARRDAVIAVSQARWKENYGS